MSSILIIAILLVFLISAHYPKIYLLEVIQPYKCCVTTMFIIFVKMVVG
jgi:hypothetical protein